MLLEKKSSFLFIPFWPLLGQFRVLVFFFSLVFFLGTDQSREEDLKEEDEKKDKRALLLSLVFDENNMIKEVFFVSSYGDLRLFFSVVVLNALSYYISLLCEMLETLDDGINVTRIFKIKMKRFLRFLERRICPHKKLRKRM